MLSRTASHSAHERRREHVVPVVRQPGLPLPDDIGPDHRRGHQQVGIVQDVVDPVAPAAQKAVPLAEGALGPGVDPALVGVARGEVADGEPLRDEEEERRQHPEPDRARTRGGRGGEPAEAQDRDDIEQHQVAQAHRARQLGRVGRGRLDGLGVSGHRISRQLER